MGKTPKIIVVILISLLVIMFFLGIYITIDEKIPDNAVVLVTSKNKLYHSIHFDNTCYVPPMIQMELSEAKEKAYKPDPHCQDLGYFRGSNLFLYQYIFSKFGIRYNSRWDKDGTWLW